LRHLLALESIVDCLHGGVLPQGMFAVDRKGQLAFLAALPTFAAHSMDTDWYAVDRQGHVALWESGEEGAVPYDAHRQSWSELSIELAMQHALLATAETSGQPSIVLLDHKARTIGLRELPSSWRGVLQFDNAAYLQMFCEEYPHLVERVLTGADHAIEVFDLVADIFRDYWDAGAIRVACILPKVVSAPALGLYEYQRKHVPRHRLLIHELPAALRDQISALQLGLDFDSCERFDPETKLKCLLYGR
jgi:hypothetical protein